MFPLKQGGEWVAGEASDASSVGSGHFTWAEVDRQWRWRIPIAFGGYSFFHRDEKVAPGFLAKMNRRKERFSGTHLQVVRLREGESTIFFAIWLFYGFFCTIMPLAVSF
jgi:hypothetical protein